MPADESSSSMWSREQDKLFEKAIATYPEDSSDRWEKIAADVPGKSVEEVKHHYELLVDDVNRIESGFVQVPCYNSSSDGSTSHAGDEATGRKGGNFGHLNSESNHGGKSSRSDQERRKGIAWTEDEHRLFLLGLDKYGKGDWRSISRNFVVTRTPTQVASHAQKYFIRLNSMNKDRRRSSIHDITSVNSGDVSVPQGPITGQTNGSAVAGPSGKSNKSVPHTPVAAPGVAMYGPPTIGQPIGGPLVSAVGTPVNLPPPPHLAYGVGAPLPGSVVPGAPLNMGPMTYPVPHTSAHRVSKNFSEKGLLVQTVEDTHEKILLSALEGCQEFLSLALYNLNLSLPTSSGALTTYENRTNFRTWLSAAGADLQTCMDGFEYAPDGVRKIVTTNLDNSTKLVVTSLAIISMIDGYMSPHEKPSTVAKIDTSSKPSSDWEPTWLSLEDRMILHDLRETVKPDVVVAADGSGDYKTINEAIEVVPENNDERFVIYVKEGVYHENVRIGKEKWNVMMYGDGMQRTIVSSNLSNGTGTSTSLSATFGNDYEIDKRTPHIQIDTIFRDMGFQNTAGAINHQAVALLSASDKSVFHRCMMDGYQDTLFAQSNRQFYRGCRIYGTIDFIFGDSSVVIQNCNIFVKRPLPFQKNTITAQGKSNPFSNTGISIQKCRVMAAEDLCGIKTFLGRPWKNYSTTVIMESRLERLIDPKGWLPWSNSTTAPDTIYYVEYNNVGPGAATMNRVEWKGLKVNDTQDDARRFTVRSFINGDEWIPSTGVPFQADL
ncbi:putative pectinesterase/pectinesterase inhibitor 24 [Sesamum alatum]|uniref:pectinesterase n=1 Tax=Sesamum alatum TaxID=300844 RepID=A0AAE1Y539_9LAMI|nr:putative pectinesterase/pectinesterase inhibitor 24 [Sesamum alatum]